jgi:hypothetical protein
MRKSHARWNADFFGFFFSVIGELSLANEIRTTTPGDRLGRREKAVP